MRISNHAYVRARERLGLNAQAFENLLQKVNKLGVGHMATKGRFRRYLDGLFREHHSAKIIIYGEHLFNFSHDGTLKTVFIIPQKFRAYALKLLHENKILSPD